MDHRNAAVEGRHRTSGGRSGITLDDHRIRLLSGEELIKTVDRAGQHPIKGLAGLDDVEIMIRHDLEELIDLIQHLPVLTSDRHLTVKVLTGLERSDDRGHLDRLGPGAVDRHDPLHAASLLGASRGPGTDTASCRTP